MSGLPFDPLKPMLMFNANVPTDFQAEIVRVIVRSYEEADRRCREEFDESEYHDMRGDWRRAVIERGLRTAAKKYGYHGAAEKNHRGTSNFSRIICGRVIITCSAAKSPEERVRFAEFRHSYAQSSQLNMFGDSSATPSPKAPLYALILHVPAENRKGQPSRPCEIRIVFPAAVEGAEGNIDYVGEPINLLTTFRQVLSEFDVSKNDRTEQIQKPSKPSLRKSKRVSA